MMAREVVHDAGCHTNGNTLRRLGISGLVEQLERLDETQDHQIYGGYAIPPIDQPVVLAVELGYTPHGAPDTSIVATLPGTVDRDGGSGGVRDVRPMLRSFGEGDVDE